MKNRGDILLSPWVCSGLVYSGVRVRDNHDVFR